MTLSPTHLSSNTSIDVLQSLTSVGTVYVFTHVDQAQQVNNTAKLHPTYTQPTRHLYLGRAKFHESDAST